VEYQSLLMMQTLFILFYQFVIVGNLYVMFGITLNVLKFVLYMFEVE
jgi:hypothetical protein